MPIMRLTQMMAAGAKKEFRFTIVTTVPDETFALPLEVTGDYDFSSAWGDGSGSDITVWNHADTIHTYATPGTYEIAITGTIIGWRFNNGVDCAKVYEIKSWGPLRLGNNNSYFYGCTNLTVTATDVLDLTGVLTFVHAFNGCSSLTTIPSLRSWDLSLVTDLRYAFYNASSFNNNFVLSSVILLDGVLQNTSFDQDISSWDVTNMTTATNFLHSATLSVANYDALILSWGPQAQTIVANFHGGNSKYTGGGAVEAARNAWVAKGWTITDGGIVP